METWRMMMRVLPLKPVHEETMARTPGQARDFQEPSSVGASVRPVIVDLSVRKAWKSLKLCRDHAGAESI